MASTELVHVRVVIVRGDRVSLYEAELASDTRVKALQYPACAAYPVPQNTAARDESIGDTPDVVPTILFQIKEE